MFHIKASGKVLVPLTPSAKQVAVLQIIWVKRSLFRKSFKGVRAHKIPRFSFSIEERGVLGEYVEVAVTRNIQFYVSTAIHHSRSIFRKERNVICICGHQR